MGRRGHILAGRWRASIRKELRRAARATHTGDKSPAHRQDGVGACGTTRNRRETPGRRKIREEEIREQ